MLGIDFTGKLSAFHQFTVFDEKVTNLIRDSLKAKVVVVLDKYHGPDQSDIILVQDHINLTGNSPLVGPNNLCGQRFVKMTDIYVNDFENLSPAITAGLKPGTMPSTEDIATIRSIGAQCWSYNLVQSTIVAAHAETKVLGLLIPENRVIDDVLTSKLLSLVGCEIR